MLTSFKVADFDDVQFISCEEKLTNDGERAVDYASGTPVYKINLSVLDEQRGRLIAESFDVTVMEVAPGKSGLEGVRPRTSVKLVNLRASMYSIEGKSGITFKADRVSPAVASVAAPKAS